MLEKLRGHPRRLHYGWGIRKGDKPLARIKAQYIKAETGREGIS